MEISLFRNAESQEDFSSKQKLEIDGMDILIIGINSNGKIEIWNQLAASTTGFPAELACGRDLYSTLESTRKFNVKNNFKSLHEILDNLIHRKRGLAESNFLLSSGKTVAMALKLISWHKNPGDLHGIILIGYDIPGLRSNMGYTHSQELLEFISCSDSTMFGLNVGIPSSPFMDVEMNDRMRIYFSFPIIKSISTDCSKRLVGEKDQDKEILSQVRDNWQDIQSFTDSLDALIFGVDSFGTVDLWNDKSAHVFGCSREEAVGKNFVQVIERPERLSAALLVRSRLADPHAFV